MEGEWQLTKKAVWSRICNSAEWLRWLCEHIYRHQGVLVERPAWLFGKTVCLVDGTEEVLHGSKKEYFMLHYSIDLFSLGMREMRLTDMKCGEKLTNFTVFGCGDIVVGDRAYGTIPGMEYLRGQGSDFVLRLRAGAFTVYDGQGERVNETECLSDLGEGESTGIVVYYQVNGVFMPLRICAVRKDKDSERAGLKRLTKRKQRKQGGKAPSAVEREYNKYIIVATSLGEEVSAGQVLELYRMRWEIELAFKRLKSLFGYGEVPMKLGKSARAWFYGKLLLAALCETLVNKGRFSPSGEQFLG
jgi:hypothetical protein